MKLNSAAVFCLCVLISLLSACRGGPRKKERGPASSAEFADSDKRRDEGGVRAQIGGYYHMKRGLNGFYPHIPNFVEGVPARVLTGGHVIQLLDSSAGGGWARVKNEKLEIGYVRRENIRIVPPDRQPKPFHRDPDEELERNMGLR